jgi:hypothetical protein
VNKERIFILEVALHYAVMDLIELNGVMRAHNTKYYKDRAIRELLSHRGTYNDSCITNIDVAIRDWGIKI